MRGERQRNEYLLQAHNAVNITRVRDRMIQNFNLTISINSCETVTFWEITIFNEI